LRRRSPNWYRSSARARSIPRSANTCSGIEALCRAGVDQGWLCRHQAGGIRYGRVIRPGAEAGNHSVDVVLMDDCRGPHHSHPGGEIDMVMPIDAGAKFDGHPAGWVVYPPGSAHTPTVSGGAALVLYLLPGGEIEFTANDN
jgi:hypothetical protein